MVRSTFRIRSFNLWRIPDFCFSEAANQGHAETVTVHGFDVACQLHEILLRNSCSVTARRRVPDLLWGGMCEAHVVLYA